MVALECRRRGERRQKELSRRRRICRARPPAGSWPSSRASPRADSGADTSPASRACTSGSRTAGSGSRPHGSCTGSRWRGSRRSSRLRRGWRRRDRSRNRLWRSDDWNRRRRNLRRRIGRGRRPKPNVAEPACPGRVAAPRASSAAACGALSPSSQCRLSLESVLRGRYQNQEQDERMCKKRGGDLFPPPLSLAWYSDRRPIVPFYVAGAPGAGVSFGDTPMTFTPAPRATSIA
jgi:hypothetical protein